MESRMFSSFFFCTLWQPVLLTPSMFRLICFASVSWNLRYLGWYHIMQACPSGTYGANCSNVCACGTGASHCDAITGCVCMTGWTGDKCHRDVNECDVESTRQQCESKGARCVNFQGGFRCQCDQGYTMDNDTGCQGNECYL